MTQPGQPSQTTPTWPPVGVRETVSLGRGGLVDVQTAVDLWALPLSAVLALIDSGQLRWAWDIGVQRGPVREIRLWQRELFPAELVRAMDLHNVIEVVIGHATERRLRGKDVGRILLVSDKTVQDLVASSDLSGAVEDRVLWVTRSSLVTFLTNRLIL